MRIWNSFLEDMEPSWLIFRTFHRFLPFWGLKRFWKNEPSIFQLTNGNFHSEPVHSTLRSTMRMCYFLFPSTIIDLLWFVLSLFLLNEKLVTENIHLTGKVHTFLAIKCLILSAFSGSALTKSNLSWCKLSLSSPEKRLAKFLFASPPGPSAFSGIHRPSLSELIQAIKKKVGG